MYRKNDQHRQQALFSSVNDLPAKQRERLEASWAGMFYSEFFCRIDEDNFAVLYSDEASRPNAPVNVLVGLEVLKAGFGWNLRSAVEATVRSLKHPFGNGKLPLRGRPRMSMIMVASAAMTNIRRIWRGQQDKPVASQAENGLWGRLWHSIQTRFWEPTPRLSSGHLMSLFSGAKGTF